VAAAATSTEFDQLIIDPHEAFDEMSSRHAPPGLMLKS
jgi:hypothetical protein